MRPAPAIFAALTVASPTPPQPTTATVSPGVTLHALKIVPAPVVTAQPITAARSSGMRSEEHTSELQSLMRISYAVFCLKKKKNTQRQIDDNTHTSLRE